MCKYTINKEELEKQHSQYHQCSNDTYIDFEMTEQQRFLLGDRMYRCISVQDYKHRLHDYPIDDRNNKAFNYLNRFHDRGRVLFVGAGVGRELLCGTYMGFESFGVTLGYDNICFGRQVLHLDDGHFMEAAMEQLPFQSGFFDIVAGFQVLEHAIAPLLFLLEQYRVLKPGGYLVLEWPPACGHCTCGSDPQHLVCYTPGQGEGLLLKAGFTEIELYYSSSMSEVPTEEYWSGNRDAGYVVAYAKKKSVHTEYTHKCLS